MIDLLNVIIILLQVLLLLRAIRKFYENPLDFSAIFIFLFIVFYASAMWDDFFGLNLYKNEFFAYYNVYPDEMEKVIFNFITTGIMIFFELGYSMKRTQKKREDVPLVINRNRLKIAQLGLFMIWLIITLYGFQSYGGSIKLFFSPARKTIYTSGYLLSIVVIIPTTLIMLSLLKHNGIKRKNLLSFLFLCGILIMTQISLGQRREIVNGVVFIALMLLSYNEKIDLASKIATNRKLRRRLIILAIFVAVLIPILWYARTYSTQIQRGETNIILPWEIRGWFELLFGSSTTGYQTTYIMKDFTEVHGAFWLHSIIFMLTIFLPRSIFTWKYMSITKTMQYTFGIEGNMSLFFVNDMYFNFGVFCFFASFLFGYFLSKYYNRFMNSKEINVKVFGIILLAQIILLFKNGYAQYIVMIVQYFMVFKFTLIFISGKRNRKRFGDERIETNFSNR